MLTFFKTVAAIMAMFSIIPLLVWAGSGNWRHALQAFREYMFIIGLLVGAGAVLALIMLVASISSIS